jgi:RNA polymerase sigma-70 factor (ECF subfamily)
MKAAVAGLVSKKFESGVNPADFREWMAAEQRRIYMLCFRLLRSSDEADSATQDVFLKAYKVLRRQEKAAIDTPAGWLTRVAVNTCLDRLRSKRWLFWRNRVPHKNEQEILRLAPATGPNQEGAILALERAYRLRMALNRLSRRQRSVFLLRHEEDCSLEEIGNILGLGVGTVKAHMFRALEKLREELRDLYGKQALE